jgi:hypothetical protein
MTSSNKPDKLDILIDQVGRLTESITELGIFVREGFEESNQRMTRLEEISQRQADAIDRQEQNINRLVGVVEKLIDRA